MLIDWSKREGVQGETCIMSSAVGRTGGCRGRQKKNKQMKDGA